QLVSHDCGKRREEVVKRVSLACAHVEDHATHAIRCASEHVGLDHVIHISKVARLFSIAVDDGTSAPKRRFDEARNYCRVGGVGILAGAENVEVTKGNSREAVNSMEDDAVLLAREFRKSVRREGILGHGFYLR